MILSKLHMVSWLLVVTWVSRCQSREFLGIQRRIISKCVKAQKPVIVATQMLHTMIKNPRPTRAEVTDIANAIFYRTDALMLSVRQQAVSIL